MSVRPSFVIVSQNLHDLLIKERRMLKNIPNSNMIISSSTFDNFASHVENILSADKVKIFISCSWIGIFQYVDLVDL